MIVYIPILHIHHEGDHAVDREGHMLTAEEMIPGYKTKRGAQAAADRAEQAWKSYGVTGDVWTVEVRDG